MNALSVSSKGIIQDSTGKTIYLRGANTAGLEYGNALGNDISQARINAVTSLMHVNLWRVAINTNWWNNNVLLTDGTTHYQTWIQQVIGWIEAAGCYVELDAGPSFSTLPSSPGPSQDTQDAGNATETLTINSHIAFWQSLVPLYVNDSNVIYNVINEPTYTDTLAQNQSMINTIQAIKSNAICILYNFNYSNVIAGSASDYTGSNLILDYHIYDDITNSWQSKFQARASDWDFIQAHGHGVMIGEYRLAGVSNNPRAYAQSCSHQAIIRGTAVAYYNEVNLVQVDNATLTPQEGAIVAATYQRIADFATGHVKFTKF